MNEIIRTDNALKRHERLCDNNHYCKQKFPPNLIKLLEYNHGEKSLKTPFIIYTNLECLLIKQQLCQNNPNGSYTEREAMHEPFGYSLDLVHLIQNKTNTIFIEERIVLKGFVVI